MHFLRYPLPHGRGSEKRSLTTIAHASKSVTTLTEAALGGGRSGATRIIQTGAIENPAKEILFHRRVTTFIQPAVAFPRNGRLTRCRRKALAEILVGCSRAVELAIGRRKPFLENVYGKARPLLIDVLRDAHLNAATHGVQTRLPRVLVGIDVVTPELEEMLRRHPET